MGGQLSVGTSYGYPYGSCTCTLRTDMPPRDMLQPTSKRASTPASRCLLRATTKYTPVGLRVYATKWWPYALHPRGACATLIPRLLNELKRVMTKNLKNVDEFRWKYFYGNIGSPGVYIRSTTGDPVITSCNYEILQRSQPGGSNEKGQLAAALHQFCLTGPCPRGCTYMG